MKAKNQVTEEQKECMVKYMESHTNVAKARIADISVRGSEEYTLHWKTLTTELNGIDGPKKTFTEWKAVSN